MKNIETKNMPMFSAPLSFSGRIRRAEYGLSILISLVSLALFSVGIKLYVTKAEDLNIALLVVVALAAYVLLGWFFVAQSIKRCQDLGKSGWWTFIPLYHFWLLFEDGQKDSNKYGKNPKKD